MNNEDKKRKIKILYFEETFGLGGIESFIVNVLKNIDLEKFEITIAAISITTDYFNSDLEKLGVNIIELLDEKISNPIRRYPRGLKLFIQFLKKNKYDMIHFHVSHAIDCLYVLAAKKLGVKRRIAHCHNSQVGQLYKLIGHKICKIFTKNTPTLYLACSKKAAEWLYSGKTIRENNYEVINNGIDAERFIYNIKVRDSFRKKLGFEDNFILGHVGRFNIQKNHQFLIEIFAEVYKRNKNARLLLIGEGELEEEMKQRAEELKIKDYIMFYGTSNEVPQLMQAMDVFVFPSLFEGLGIAVIESQASSLMTISSAVVPAETKITEYIKYMSLGESAGKWAEEILEYKKGYCRRNTYSDVCEHGYDIKSVVSKIESLYLQEIQNN